MSAPPKETEWARRQRRNQERAEHVTAHGPACQICGNVPKRGLDADHDHKGDGRTRGWLCHRCNRALPSWVTVRWLLLAAAYLAKDDPEHKVVESAHDGSVIFIDVRDSA